MTRLTRKKVLEFILAGDFLPQGPNSQPSCMPMRSVRQLHLDKN